MMIGLDSHPMVSLVAEEPDKIVTIDFGVDTATFDVYGMISRVYSKGGPQSKTCQSMDMIIECSDEEPLVALPAEALAKAGQGL